MCFDCAAQVSPTAVFGSGGRPPLIKPEPGDRVYVDPATEDVVVESRGLKRVIVRTTHVAPTFMLNTKLSAKGADYSFHLQNGPSAKQSIWMFLMELPDFAQVTAPRNPDHWMFVGAYPRDLVQGPWAAWGRSGRDDDDTLWLVPGQRTGPFAFTSNAWPGLTTVRVLGWKPFPKPGEDSDEDDDVYAGRNSEWALEKARTYLSTDSNSVHVLILGPRIKPSGNILPAVMEELKTAAGRQEFAALKDELTELESYYPNEAALTAQLKVLSSKNSGLPQKFFEAMLTNLDAAAKLR